MRELAGLQASHHRADHAGHREPIHHLNDRGQMSTRLPRIADEQGFAIVIAIATITVTVALAAALVTASGTFLHSSSRDGANKRALAAAEAGLNAGLYRF